MEERARYLARNTSTTSGTILLIGFNRVSEGAVEKSFPFWQTLKQVSRSFYLSLWLLPSATRQSVALAYLLARAGDTIADTPLVPYQERIRLLELLETSLKHRLQTAANAPSSVEKELLKTLRKQISQASYTYSTEGEAYLLLHLQHCLKFFSAQSPSAQKLIEEVLEVIFSGMRLDLEYFSSSSLRAFSNWEQLEDYCYRVAGVVGEFWTKIHKHTLPTLEKQWDKQQIQRGVAFGKALQMTNILRDIQGDLKRNRVYLPHSLLQEVNLAPEDLREAENGKKLTPVYAKLLAKTAEFYQQGIEYLLAIPRRYMRLRFACFLPLAIGLETLHVLWQLENPLAVEGVKIPRKRVYTLLAWGGGMITSNTWLTHFLTKRLKKLPTNL
ncbi:MAG: phytoene/squalene synthase family protein [Planctomycetota bacterium]|nr:MAG: phytoene/squalene synthase family protein [Planctomycetota bacterium]